MGAPRKWKCVCPLGRILDTGAEKAKRHCSQKPIARYDEVSLIGSGNMGEVYLVLSKNWIDQAGS